MRYYFITISLLNWFVYINGWQRFSGYLNLRSIYNKKTLYSIHMLSTPFDKSTDERSLNRFNLNKQKEVKSKEQFDSTKHPEVIRAHSSKNRVPLTSISVGQKMRGRIITVKEFGMFVDVGSKKRWFIAC